MKLSELIYQLAQLPPSTEVLLKDDQDFWNTEFRLVPWRDSSGEVMGSALLVGYVHSKVGQK